MLTLTHKITIKREEEYTVYVELLPFPNLSESLPQIEAALEEVYTDTPKWEIKECHCLIPNKPEP